MHTSLIDLSDESRADTYDKPSTFVFVGNNKGFATAICAPASASYALYQIPSLPGGLVVPTDLFGISHGLFEYMESYHGEPGDFDGHLFQLLGHLASHAVPEEGDRQAARANILAEKAVASARSTFNHTEDLAYSTDLRSSYLFERKPWALKTKVSDQTLHAYYGQIVEDHIAKGFSGVRLTEHDRHMVQTFVFDELREVFSAEASSVHIFGLSADQRVPTLGEFTIDGFLADQLKVEHDPWIPMHIKDGMGYIHVESLAIRPSQRSSPILHSETSRVSQFVAALRQIELHSVRSSEDVECLANMMAKLTSPGDQRVIWCRGDECCDAPPPSFDNAPPEALLEIATCLAQAALGPSELGNARNIVSTFTAAV